MQPCLACDLLHADRGACVAQQVEHAAPALAEREPGVGREERLHVHDGSLHQTA